MGKSKIKYKSDLKKVHKILDLAQYTALLAIGEWIVSTIVVIITSKKIVDTGRLRASISYVVGKATNFGKIDPPATNPDDRPQGDSKPNQLFVGTNVEYAMDHELGTSRVRPRPYITPAVMNNKTTIKEIFQKEYRKVVDKND